MSQMPLSHTIKQSYLKDKKSSSTETQDKSLCLGDYLELCFKENQNLWSETYPGLTLQYLKQHFYDSCGNRFPLNLFYNQWFGGEVALKWEQYFSMLNLGRPLAYISKEAFFFDTDFYVDERVLIPRFETEVLLEQIFDELKSLDKILPCRSIKVAEVGVGPGTLSLSVAQKKYVHPLSIEAGDISQDALDVCRLNLFRLGFVLPKENHVELFESDRLEKMSGHFDIIYSNPPYIKKQADLNGVHKQVLENEPELALFLEDETYEDWFTSFFIQVGEKLNNDALFLMEGHEEHLKNQLNQIQSIFPCEGEIIKDLTGRDRILKVRKKNG